MDGQPDSGPGRWRGIRISCALSEGSESMNPPAVRRFPWTVGVGLLLLVLALSLAFLLAKAQSRLARQPLPVLAPVADFSLTNQNNAAVSLAEIVAARARLNGRAGTAAGGRSTASSKVPASMPRAGITFRQPTVSRSLTKMGNILAISRHRATS